MTRTLTPGPWKADGTIYEHMVSEIRCVLPGEERGIAQVWQHANGFADALLMAAAPDMAAALRRLVEIADVPVDDDDFCEAITDARAALSKAGQPIEAIAALQSEASA